MQPNASRQVEDYNSSVVASADYTNQKPNLGRKVINIYLFSTLDTGGSRNFSLAGHRVNFRNTPYIFKFLWYFQKI